MEAVSVGGLKRARGGAYNGPEAAAAATLKKLRLDAATAAAAAAAAMNMPPTGHTPPLGQQQQQQAAQGAVNAAVAADGQVVQVTGMCNSIDSVGPGEEEVNAVNISLIIFLLVKIRITSHAASAYTRLRSCGAVIP